MIRTSKLNSLFLGIGTFPTRINEKNIKMIKKEKNAKSVKKFFKPKQFPKRTFAPRMKPMKAYLRNPNAEEK